MSSLYPVNSNVRKGDEVVVIEVRLGQLVALLKTEVVFMCKTKDYCWVKSVHFYFGRVMQSDKVLALMHIPTGTLLRYVAVAQQKDRNKSFFKIPRKWHTYYKRLLQTADPHVPTLRPSKPEKTVSYHDGRGNIIEVTSS